MRPWDVLGRACRKLFCLRAIAIAICITFTHRYIRVAAFASTRARDKRVLTYVDPAASTIIRGGTERNVTSDKRSAVPV